MTVIFSENMIRFSLWLLWLVIKIYMAFQKFQIDNWNLRNVMFSSHVTPHLQHIFQFPFFANQNYILAEQTPTYKKWIELVDELVVIKGAGHQCPIVLKGLKPQKIETLKSKKRGKSWKRKYTCEGVCFSEAASCRLAILLNIIFFSGGFSRL